MSGSPARDQVDRRTGPAGVMHEPDALTRFWEQGRTRAGLGRIAVITGTSAAMALPPPAWSFGRDPEQADALLALVLAGAKTAAAGAAAEYEAAGEQPPRAGDLAIVLDGADHPRALLRTTAVRVVPFDEVDADHATAEGEGDLSLEYWRASHREYFAAELAERGLAFSSRMPVVLERFELLYPRPCRSPVRQPVASPA